MPTQDPPAFTVSGRITNTRGVALPRLTARAYFRSAQGAERSVGPAAATDAQGRYLIELGADDLRRAGRDGATVVFVRAFDGDRRLGESGTQPAEGQKVVIDLRLDTEPKDASLRVHGVVRDQYGDPMDGVTVEAFDRDLRHEQSLGRSPAQQGRYEIRYTPAQFRKAEKGSADLVMKVFGKDGKELYKTPVSYNAPDDYELDINLQGAAYNGPSEWDVLTGTLTPLLESVAPRNLREDGEHQDVSFLAGETGYSRLTLGTWIACHRLADKTAREQTPLPGEVFFGFLRQGQPSLFYDSLLQDIQHPDRMVLLEDKILRGLAELIPDLQQSLLAKAVAENIVPARIGARLKDILDALHRIKVRFAGDTKFGGGKGTVAQLLALTPAAKDQTAFLTAFSTHTGPLRTFWKKLEEDKVLRPEVVKQVKLTFELGALTRNHIPLVGELAGRFQSGALKSKRELAKYSRADWKAVLQSKGPDGKPVGVPSNIDGETADAKMDEFAAILDRQFERTYPTASFAAKLGRAERSPVPATKDVARFLDNNPEFLLDRHRVEHYFAEHKDALAGVQDREALTAGLKAVQRVFKLNPTHTAVDALLARKIDSAQQIYFIGQGQFLQAMKDSGVNAIEAKNLFRKAEYAYAGALALFGEYNVAVNGPSPLALPSQVPDPEVQAKITSLPNLRTLFGSLDYCECTHCRSVYSPAAHFVDVLRYLGERGTHGTGVNAGKTVLQVLFERRPDLGEIELSCENTNTPLPYIDLVNEILEEVVAPPTPVALSAAIQPDLVDGPIAPTVLAELTGKGVAVTAGARVYAPDARGQWAVRDAQHAYKVFTTGAALRLLPTRQTFLSAAELRANPEYTNADAYTKLRGEVFPIRMPFDLWHAQTRAYLAHLGVPHPRLLELFQQTQPDGVTLVPGDLQIDCAWLGLTETERKIVTGALAGKQSWDFWGLTETGNNVPDPENPADPTENVTGTWVQVLGDVNVMLHRSGLTYKEFLQLLDMRSVNPDGGVFVFDTADPNAANCDTSQFTIRNLSPAVLDRMHRFVRLWRNFGCAMWELDLLLPDADPAPGVVDKRITDAALRDIAGMNRLREQTGLDWRAVYSLYNPIDHNVYVDRDRGVAVQTLYQRLFRNKLVDAVASFPPAPDEIAGPIADLVPGILAAFRIKETDLGLILADLGLAQTDTLDADRLTRVYRITALAQALGLSTDSFLRLKRLWAQDPFANPGATRAFVALSARVAASAFSVPELDYLLTDQSAANSGVALDDKTSVAALQAVRDGLQKIRDDVRRKSEETNAAYVKSKLGQLPALSKDADQVTALSVIDGTWTGTPAAQDALIDAFFAGVLDPVQAKTELAALPGGLSPAARQAAVDARYDFVQPGLEAFLLRTQTENFIRQKTAEVFQLDVPSAAALLDGLRLPGGSNSLLLTINDARLLQRQPDGTYTFALDEATFPDIFKSLRLLHKVALVIGKLQIKADEVVWWLTGTRAADMGWMHPRDFPIDPSTPLDIEKWLAFQQFFQWKGELPASDRTAFEFAADLLDGATSSADNVAALAALTGWDEGDITALAAAFHWGVPSGPFDALKQELRKSANLVRLADCMKVLRRLGVSATARSRGPRPSRATPRPRA